MAQVTLPPPRLPEPPDNIDRRYMEDLIRAIQLFITQERTAGEMRATKITLTNLPTSATGLETGSLYNDSGTIKIVT
tara:strand:- start:113 stop:343 length:231 start_codon:yes stop_codon:yes gene_type:complete